ncbi:MAG: hypothetical protein LUD84_03615 [Clostridiales bacterium]|nr:hypothetical protein [Clostridiales bacterium]
MMNTGEPSAFVKHNGPEVGIESENDMKYAEDTEERELAAYCQKAYEKTRERLIAADCCSAARRLKQYMEQFYTGPSSVRAIGVDWTGVLASLLELYCRDAILNQIQHTPKNARGKWTKELLDQKIELCGLDAAAKNEIYKVVGLEPAECAS